MNKPVLPQVEFYVTNVCNYNCEGCNRFNNYYFKGHKYWDEHCTEYEEWGRKVDIDTITIIGGEPTLNPDLINWVSGISRIWPNATLKIATNGSRLDLIWNDLYTVLKQHPSQAIVELSIHDKSKTDNLVDKCKQYLTGKVSIKYEPLNDDHERNIHWSKQFNLVKDASWPECNTRDEFYNLSKNIQDECINVHRLDPLHYEKEISQYRANYNLVELHDKDNVIFRLRDGYSFRESALIRNGTNLKLHNSNPQEAFDVCVMKNCHQFENGKLYLCAIPTVLPEFIKQFHVDMTADDIELLSSYDPLTLHDTDNDVNEFIRKLPHVIPLCKFCPSNKKEQEIKASTKKIKLCKK